MIGAATGNYAFTVVGGVFVVIALANRHKWKEDSNLTPNKQRALYLLIALIGLATLVALAARN